MQSIIDIKEVINNVIDKDTIVWRNIIAKYMLNPVRNDKIEGVVAFLYT
jgi:hypothetical protein